MTEEQKENMKRDAFYLFYNDRVLWRSYKEVYDLLVAKGYPIHNEGSDAFKHNDIISEIYSELIGFAFLPREAVMYGSHIDASVLSQKHLEVPRVLRHVPYFKTENKNKSISDIYVISLEEFHRNWETGLSFIEYSYFIKIEQGLNFQDPILTKIFIEIAGLAGSGIADNGIKYWATIESIFRLLEFQELQESFKQSKEAKQEAQKSMSVAVLSIIITFVTFGVSLWFMIVQTDVAQQTYSLDVSNTIKADSSHVLDSILYYQKESLKKPKKNKLQK